MRTISDLKTAIAQARKNHTFCGYMEAELRRAIIDGIPSDRLEAICDAERDGMCVVLPCKVGDTLYIHRDSLCKKSKSVVSGRCVAVKVDYSGFWVDIIIFNKNIIKNLSWITEVFESEEEAEQALKERV